MTYFFFLLLAISIITLALISLKGESVGFENNQPDYFTLSNSILSNHRSKLLVSLCVNTLRKSTALMKKRDKLFEYENWLYDNSYKVEQRLKDIKKTKVSLLPSYRGMPRIYYILNQCLNENDGKIEKWQDYIAKFNNYGYLQYRETVALSEIATYALCEYLTTFYSKSYVARTLYLKGKKDGANRKIDLHSIKYASYLLGLLQNADTVFEKRLKKLLQDNGMDLYGKIADYRCLRDEYCVKVKNAILSLSNIYTLFSPAQLLKANKINSYLQKCDGVFYRDNDDSTKMEYLRLISKKSKNNKEMLSAIQSVEKSKKTGKDLYSVLLPQPLSSFSYIALFVLRFVFALALSIIVWIRYSPVFAVFFFAVAYALIKHVCRFLAQKSPNFTPRTNKITGKTLIVISALILSENDAKYAVKRAQTVKIANPSFDVCLLVDLKDDKDKVSPLDKEIISLLSASSDIYCVVRERRHTKDGYVAWEKKRGAICQLFRHILGKETEFAYSNLPKKDYTYALTLDIDSDIILAERAVRAIEHPYFSSSAVLSFSSLPSLTSPKTLYAKLFTDNASGYSCCGFSVENDMFDKGNYTGKGICKIKEFYERTASYFPDGKILSHDFIEGAVAGCRNCDVSVLESSPTTYGQNLARESRWIRGDWQLLPYLFSTVKDRAGNKRKNGIGVVNKAHVASNMFSSLYPIFLLACILSARGYFMLLALALPIFSILISLPKIFISPKVCLKSVLRQLYLLATLPFFAITSLYSIALTLVRLVRNKNLLQWKTFRHAGIKNYNALFSLPFSAFAFFLAFVNNDVGLLVMGIIFLSGALSFLLDITPSKKEQNVNLKKTALDLINATTSYFVNAISASPLSLIPDFYSEESNKYSSMTSPTNIGFSLIALRCAYKTGFMQKSEFVEKTDKIMESIESLKKYRGHLYNWYDVNTGEPLAPKYVSSVDSGNFCISLCFVKDDLSPSSQLLAEKFISNIEFEFLVNPDKNLLVTGFCDSTKKTDLSCYDLYASESLLTYLFCIGYNKIDGKCAFSLDQNQTNFCGNTLYSWTGGAFEYLMTSLFIPYEKGSSLYRSALSHSRAQRRYAKPFWGISESQYNAYDDSGNRKYKAFGIKQTAYKDALGTARAPYASALCLEFAPKKTINNLNACQSWGMRGRYGLYESYDGQVIKTYMAHHQGMIILALTNALTENKDKLEFSSLPPLSAGMLYLLKSESEKRERRIREIKLKHKDTVTVKSETVYKTNVLTRSSYATAYSNAGESEAFFDQKCVYTRGGNDIVLTLLDRSYSLFSGAKCALDESICRFVTDNSLFRASVTVTVLGDMDGEIREVEITNKTDFPQNYTLAFYLEPILVRKEEYVAHKTYSKMFTKTSVCPSTVIAYNKQMAVAQVLQDSDVKEVDRGKIFRKFSSITNVDCCLFSAKKFTLESEKSATIYSGLICAKSKNLAQNLANVFLKSDKSTLMELSKRRTASNSVGEKVKNTVSAVSESQSAFLYGIDKPVIMLDCSENRLYKLKEVTSAIIKASYFSPRFCLCITYAQSDGYFKSEGNRAREEVGVARRENGDGNVSFIFLEKSLDKEKIEKLSQVAVRELSQFQIYPKKPLLTKKQEEYAPVNLPPIVYPTDCGGFYKGGFLIDKTPPKCWSNVVSNGNVGFVATERGGGFTFYSSSRQEKITEFSFDPIKDDCNEGIVFSEDNLVWSASPSPCGQRCYCMHSSGKTVYKTGYNGMLITQKIGVGGNNKFVVINIKNNTDKPRKIHVTFFAKIVLGDFVENTENCITYARKGNVLHAKNLHSGLEVNLSSNKDVIAYSFDLSTQKTKNGEIVKVKDFAKSEAKNGFVYTVCVCVEKEKQVVFSLGKNPAPDFSKAENLIEEFSEQSANMSAIKIATLDMDVDCVFDWLIPQTYFSRFKARCGYYQVGGAFGFRDQLQDCLALLYACPDQVREHILYCASRQFESGDVLHWWHHPYTGVRTRISDDRLFLGYVTAKYIQFTGDKSILDESVPFLKDVPFDKVLYTSFTPTEYKTSLKDHIVRAIHSCKFAPNGLVLMGDGDWNDAMDKAGSRGEGSSVWLSMFLYAVINECKEFLINTDFYERILARLKESVEKTFDGNSFARLITDEGRMLGYDDGFVDLITQSWAVLSSIADEKTCLKALDTAEKLVDKDKRIIKLLSPSFSEDTKIGSIGKYPKGVRENGGQYTHGAVWYVMALYKIGQKEKAYEYLKYLLPSTHCKNGASSLYKAEPYVICADVYESGEGGWSWYTGSSSWTYVLIVEYLFGVKKTGNVISLSPNLPKKIESAQISLCFDGVNMRVDIDNTKDGEWKFVYDGVRYETNSIMINPKNHGKKFKLVKA